MLKGNNNDPLLKYLKISLAASGFVTNSVFS